MGRKRHHNTDLPTCTYEHHGGYRYSYRLNGKAHWLFLGRNRKAAIKRAETLNSLKNSKRAELLSAMRTPSDELRRQVGERNSYSCVYCGAETGLVVDHFIPFEVGGATHINNLVTACVTCNSVKGSRHPVEFLSDVLSYRDRLFDEIIDRFIPHELIYGPVSPETKNRGIHK